MYLLKKLIALAIFSALLAVKIPLLDAVSYVTDTGGYAYDESRAVTNLAPAIALGTVAVVGVIAIAVQNSHDRHSSSSSYSSSSHYGYYSDSSNSCSSNSCCYYTSGCSCH